MNAACAAQTHKIADEMTRQSSILDSVVMNLASAERDDYTMAQVIPALDVAIATRNYAGHNSMTMLIAFARIVSEADKARYEADVTEASGVPHVVWAIRRDENGDSDGVMLSRNQGYFAPLSVVRPPGSFIGGLSWGLDMMNTVGREEPVEDPDAALSSVLSVFHQGTPLMTADLPLPDNSEDRIHLLVQAVYSYPNDDQARSDAVSFDTFNENLYTPPTGAEERVSRAFGFVITVVNLKGFIADVLAEMPAGVTAIVVDATNNPWVTDWLVASGVVPEGWMSPGAGEHVEGADLGFAIPTVPAGNGAKPVSSGAIVLDDVDPSLWTTVPCDYERPVATMTHHPDAEGLDRWPLYRLGCAEMATSEPELLLQQVLLFGSRVFLVRYGGQQSVIDARLPASIWSIEAPHAVMLLVVAGTLLVSAIFMIVAHLWNVRASRREETHKRANAEAAKAAHAAVMSYLSHELRNPLHAAAASVDFLKDSVPIDSPLRTDVDAISTSLSNARMLVDDVLDHAKLESGKLVIQPSEVSLRAVVESMMLQHQSKAGSVSVTGTVDRQVPRRVMVDELRVRQLLANGISNSLRHCVEGSVDVHVFMAPPLGTATSGRKRSQGESSTDADVPPKAVSGRPETLVMLVADDGNGLGGIDAETLFRPFAQGAAATPASRGRHGTVSPSTDLAKRGKLGTGLGLAICRLLARAMGGDCGLYDRLEGPPSLLQALGHDILSLGLAQPAPSDAARTPSTGSSGDDVEAGGGAESKSVPRVAATKSSGAVFWVVLPVTPVATLAGRRTSDFRGPPLSQEVDATALDKGVASARSVASEEKTPLPASLRLRTHESGTGTFNDDSLMGRHVVCVDDDAINRRLLVRMLQSLGATAVALTDGDELIPHLREHHPTLFDASPSQHGDSSRAGRRVTPVAVLLDIMMARVGGIEACGLLREAGVELPCIATTGNASSHDRDVYLRSGFQDVVSKPFDKHQLARVLAKHVANDDDVEAWLQ